MRRAVRRSVRCSIGAGASVSLYGGAKQARQELSQAHRSCYQYDVILLDAQMPADIGIELSREFDPSDRESTIIMLTSDDLPREPRVARECGLGRHLLKPIRRAWPPPSSIACSIIPAPSISKARASDSRRSAARG